MQSKFQIDAFLPWEVGLIVILIGLILVFIGNKQSKKKESETTRTTESKDRKKSDEFYAKAHLVERWKNDAN
mgnify:CR=1 FL=1